MCIVKDAAKLLQICNIYIPLLTKNFIFLTQFLKNAIFFLFISKNCSIFAPKISTAHEKIYRFTLHAGYSP